MLPLLLFLAILMLPALEVYVIIQVGMLIGGWPTAALLIGGVVLGVWLVRREGRRAWQVLQDSLRRGVVPEREINDAGMTLAGGMLLVVPGFITDVLGLLLILPLTRPAVRRLMGAYGARRRRVLEERLGASSVPGRFPEGPGEAYGGQERVPGPVIQGQVVREEPEHRENEEPGSR